MRLTLVQQRLGGGGGAAAAETSQMINVPFGGGGFDAVDVAKIAMTVHGGGGGGDGTWQQQQQQQYAYCPWSSSPLTLSQRSRPQSAMSNRNR